MLAAGDLHVDLRVCFASGNRLPRSAFLSKCTTSYESHRDPRNFLSSGSDFSFPQPPVVVCTNTRLATHNLCREPTLFSCACLSGKYFIPHHTLAFMVRSTVSPFCASRLVAGEEAIPHRNASTNEISHSQRIESSISAKTSLTSKVNCAAAPNPSHQRRCSKIQNSKSQLGINSSPIMPWPHWP